MFFIPHYYLFSLTPSLLYSLFPKHKHQEADYLNLEAEKAGIRAGLTIAECFHLPHSLPGQCIHVQNGRRPEESIRLKEPIAVGSAKLQRELITPIQKTWKCYLQLISDKWKN